MEKIGRYRITHKLGEGGMGVVYAARDERLDRAVAIKTIRTATADPAARERLWREARSAASVSHPNICQLYEIVEENGELFIAMELLEGETLVARIERGPLPLAEAVQSALGILAALDALHQRGLVHRDLKTSNVFLTPHGVKLLDFGLARPFDTGTDQSITSLTLPGTVVGTPRYMAPEALTGGVVDARSDLFAVGIIVFEMLTGRSPFRGETTLQVLHAILHDQPPALTGSAAIAAADRVIRRTLAKNPADRPPSAAAIAAELRSVLSAGDTGQAPRVQSITRLIVLPFRLLRPDDDTGFLAFSLPDAVAASLAGLEALVVRSTLAAARFAADTLDLQRIATEADVDVVLTGTLLRAGDQIRVTTQLVEAPAGTLLWTQSLQAPLGDTFQLQDVLTQRIVEALSLPLTAGEHRLLTKDVPASAKAYECYLRANSLGSDQTRDWPVMRDLYEQCLAEDPRFAPAWARLGRVYRLMAKYFAEDSAANLERAERALTRALELNPDLAVAHNNYAQLEVDLGRARDAMVRLVTLAAGRRSDPELFAGLCSACRYCGLLEASLASHEEARRLDPRVPTSVVYTYFAVGDWPKVVEGGHDGLYIGGIALMELGRAADAIEWFRTAETKAPERLRNLLEAGRLLVEGDRVGSLGALDRVVGSFVDPEPLFYAARQYARLEEPGRALALLARVVDGGYMCYPAFARDPWLEPLQGDPGFQQILGRAERHHREAAASFRAAGGERVLGVRRV